MRNQLTLRLPDELAERLETVSKRLRRKRSEVVRLALELFLSSAPPQARAIDQVRDLLGRVESGVPDLGQQHREYLVKRLRNGW